ncbi:MAG: hypothetical protein HC892_01525 [Saprospiraceae bacterium]|nr:hypothetical protein [Saprospiraceae bacterium]
MKTALSAIGLAGLAFAAYYLIYKKKKIEIVIKEPVVKTKVVTVPSPPIVKTVVKKVEVEAPKPTWNDMD